MHEKKLWLSTDVNYDTVNNGIKAALLNSELKDLYSELVNEKRFRGNEKTIELLDKVIQEKHQEMMPTKIQ